MTNFNTPETRRQDAMDQIKVMLLQERSDAYRCADYLGAAKRRRRRRRPSSSFAATTNTTGCAHPTASNSNPPLTAQIAAVEECFRFIGSLTVGEDCSFASLSRAASTLKDAGATTREEEMEEPPPSRGGKMSDFDDAGGRVSPSSVASPLPEPPASAAEGGRWTRRWPSFRMSFSRQGSAVEEEAKHKVPIRAGAPGRVGIVQEEVSSASTASPLERWRKQMAEWSFGAVDAFGFSRRTAVASLSLVDRYLSSRHKQRHVDGRAEEEEHHKDDFQLLCMTCLYTSIKIHEPNVKLSAEAVAEMSRGVFARDDVVEQEAALMKELGWRMSGPLAMCFTDRFVDLLLDMDGSWEEEDAAHLRWACRGLCEASAANGQLVSCHRSCVGLACVMVALEDCGEEDPETTVDELIMSMEEEGVAIDEDELSWCLSLLWTM